MYKKIIYILFLILFTTSCGTFDSVKRGITGEKRDTVDAFLIKKKDPLILPPDFENLPTPDERITAEEEISNFEKTLESTIGDASSSDGTSSSTGSVEDSIIKQIQKK